MKVVQDNKCVKKLVEVHDFISELTKPVTEKFVYHYTTIEALFNGIVYRNSDSQGLICLWATNALYMNDVSELKTGFRFASKIFRDYFVSLENEQTIDDLTDMISDYYLLSFSLRRDYLSMWRMYSNNATGVSLCFDVGLLEKVVQHELIKCIYLTDDIISHIQTSLSEFKSIKMSEVGLFFIILIALFAISKSDTKKETVEQFAKYVKFIVALKDCAYVDEDEIRLITNAVNDEMKFRLRENKIVPYVERFFPKEALTEIIIGPNNDIARTAYSLRTYLNKIGFEHVKVTISEIPYGG